MCVGGGGGGCVCVTVHNAKRVLGFPGGAVVKNLPCNAGDMGSTPSPERSHMPWSNKGQVQQPLSLPP